MQKVFSHSSLGSFEKCPKQYHYRYIEKLPVESESIEAFVGKRVHEILERLHLFVDQGRTPSLRRVLDRYQANWDEHWDEKRIRIVRTELDAAAYRQSGAQCLENYYRRCYPFDQLETVGLEKRIHFRLDPEGSYKIRGVIDRIARARDGTLEIQDYKTSRRVPPQSVLDRDRQLALYELGIRESLGEEGPIRLVWHFVMADQQRSSTRTPEQLADVRQETCDVIDRIRVESEWAPKPSALCAWCEYRQTCPAGSGDGVD